jgi:hypothetical protein
MQAKKSGPKVIDKMIGKFQGIVDGLDKGVELCQTEQDRNTKVIDSLSTKNGILEQKASDAKVFRDNLKDMLTKKSEEKKED